MKSGNSLDNQNIVRIRNCIHPNCIICGLENYKGMKINYTITNNNEISTEIYCDQLYEGYSGMMHGGIISAVLDGAMTNCLFARGKIAVTVEMTIKYKLPVEINMPATVNARILQNSGPLYYLESEIIQNGKVKACAKGKFFNQPQLQKTTENMELKL